MMDLSFLIEDEQNIVYSIHAIDKSSLIVIYSQLQNCNFLMTDREYWFIFLIHILRKLLHVFTYFSSNNLYELDLDENQ